MVFSTSLFLLYFLPLFLLLYHLSPTKHKNTTALIASLLFYVWGAPGFIFILLGSIVLDFFFTSKFSTATNKKKYLVLSLVLNVGLLAYFKYANFFVDNVNHFISNLGFNELAWTKIALPIGISFFTFQKISYSVDVYRGISKPLKSISNYALYILLFPQLIAGPIVRYSDIAKQLINRKQNETYNNKLKGFYRFIIGLSKKVIIANSVGVYADTVFNTPPNELSLIVSWLGLLAYGMQIYFDFSGYSDMAIGIGKIIGFNFPENFNNPYISKNITEFWRRWHITLSNWMRDYIYIPLGGNRASKYRLYVNLWIVFLISGLWHGASWNFVVWGAFHGLFLTLDKLFLRKAFSKIGWLSIIPTFILVLLSWVVFRCNTIEHSLLFYKSLFTANQVIPDISINTKTLFFIAIASVLSFITLLKKGAQIEKFLFSKPSYTIGQHVLLSIASVILFLVCVGYINIQEFNPFIYFRF